MAKFSVDYRSPPSGFGQIFRSERDSARQMTLISFKGCGLSNDPAYGKTIYIDTDDWSEIIWQTYQILEQLGVTEVYDSELYFHGNEALAKDSDCNFDLDVWYQLRGE